MSGKSEPGTYARRSLLRRVLGAGAAVLFGAPSREAGAEEVHVTIDNFTFAPTPMIISVGSTVTWMNHDDIPHTVVCPKLGMKSQTLDTDDSFSYRFERSGTFDYTCGLHPHMRGQVRVL
jgi:plastocyanin